MLLFSHLLILSFHQFLFFLLLPLFLYQLLLCQKALHRRTLLCYFHLKIPFFFHSYLFFFFFLFFFLFFLYFLFYFFLFFFFVFFCSVGVSSVVFFLFFSSYDFFFSSFVFFLSSASVS